jgi:hypothetical protein
LKIREKGVLKEGNEGVRIQDLCYNSPSKIPSCVRFLASVMPHPDSTPSCSSKLLQSCPAPHTSRIRH